MPDFTPSNPGAMFPAYRVVAVTPSDTTDLTGCRALWIGGLGSLALRCVDNTSTVSLTVPAGTLLPVFASRVMAATTASNIVAFY
jgi:hypothetical protein